MRRRLLSLAATVAAGVAAGATWERLHAKKRERLDVYFDDGSFVTYVEGSADAGRLLPFARQVVAAMGENRPA